MPLNKLERIKSEHPSFTDLIERMAAYVQAQASSGSEIVPKVAAVKLRVSEAVALGILNLFRHAGIVRARYDVVCPRTGVLLGSAYDKKELEPHYECGSCGVDHDIQDAEIQLVFEIASDAGGLSGAAA